MKWLKFLGLLFAHIGSLFVAYRQGNSRALAEVKTNNAKKQADYVAIQEKHDAVSVKQLADELQDGTRRF